MEFSRGLYYFSLIPLIAITFNHKCLDVLFHIIPKKRVFEPLIGFGET
jgi:hypothetical protein